MKFSENSLVVDVIKISNSSYKLSVPAGDLLAAAMNGAVLRRHDLSTAAVPNVLYVPLSEAKLQSGTYTFTFASGDAFTASAADAYPAASSVSDKTDSELPAVAAADKGKFLHTNESTGALEWAEGGSGGGGPLIVTDTEGTLDKTVTEITAADFAVVKYEEATGFVASVVLDDKSGEYDVRVLTVSVSDGSVDTVHYIASSASGYPTQQSA